MASWRNPFRRQDNVAAAEGRFGVDQWAEQWFTYQNHGYPILGGTATASATSEPIPNDFEGYINSAYKSNGVVFACMVARQMIFTEARFAYQRMRDGRPEDLFYGDAKNRGARELDVLEKPWPNGTTGELLARAIQDVDLAGNHYVIREGRRLRRLRPDWVEIILTAPPEEAVQSDVAGYLYRPGNTKNKEKWKFYPVEDSRIAHWAPIPDPEAQYRGMSWLTPVLREIMSDKAATLHKQKFFDNAATPNLAVSFKETVSAKQFKEFMEMMQQDEQRGVDGAYKTLYLGGGADVSVVGADLKQLDFKVTQGAGETRIAAAARVHPVVVGLSEGMQGSSLNAGNFKAAKDSFGDQTIRPLWRGVCAAYSSLIKVPPDARLWFDDRDIAFLRQDQTEVAEIMAREAEILAKLVQNGYTPDSAVEAMTKQDWRLLKHTGLYSVQLLPPESQGPATPGAPGGSSGPQTPKNGNAGGQEGKPSSKPAQGKPAAPVKKAPAKPAAAKPKPQREG